MNKFISTFKNFTFTAILLVASCCFFCSCPPDPEFEATLTGSVVSSKDNVHNGEEITLSIGPLTLNGSNISIDISSGSSITINGKGQGVPRVHYYIDGEEVGNSNDPSTKFEIKYKVTGLSVGPHTISATAEPQEKGTTFRGGYQSSTINVVED